MNPSPRDKKGHTRVHKGSKVQGWVWKATPQAPLLFSVWALHAPLLSEGERWSLIFFSASGFPLYAYVVAAAY